MLTETALTELKEEEVDADPLIILSCGHVFCMSAVVSRSLSGGSVMSRWECRGVKSTLPPANSPAIQL